MCFPPVCVSVLWSVCEPGFWLTLGEPSVAEDDSDSTSRLAAAAFLMEALSNSTLIRIFLKIAT